MSKHKIPSLKHLISALTKKKNPSEQNFAFSTAVSGTLAHFWAGNGWYLLGGPPREALPYSTPVIPSCLPSFRLLTSPSSAAKHWKCHLPTPVIKPWDFCPGMHAHLHTAPFSPLQKAPKPLGFCSSSAVQMCRWILPWQQSLPLLLPTDEGRGEEKKKKNSNQAILIMSPRADRDIKIH